jgi:uncharacterized Zn finger protein/ERCC4-related helicase
MSKHFGKTWWGEQWLKSLTNIDYSNRLPRGSTYARNGSIASISIDANTIKAKVQGSRPKPYDVIIIIPPFFDPEIRKLIKAVADKPVIISKLLNRELDPELLNIAENIGLRVFPRQWTDFKMQCSCPDWAVPCKHLAAVIYKLSAEIDNNPFLVFQLHRVDLPAELKKQNIHIEDKGNKSIPSFKTLMLPQSNTGRKKDRKTITADVVNPYAKPDFSSLIPISDPLIQLLADAPVFYQNAGNFREKYAAALRRVARSAQKVLHEKATLEEIFKESTPSKVTKPFEINHHTRCRFSLNADNRYSLWANDKKSPVSIDQLVLSLWQLSPGRMQDYQPSIVALRSVLLLGVNLAANGAIVPQIYKTAGSKYGIRWLPALLSGEVSSLVKKLKQSLPGGLLWLDDQETSGERIAINLLSIFLNALVHQLSGNQAGDIFLELFFSNYTHPFNRPGQEALPGGIQSWLQRYYITQGNYKPTLLVEELRNEKFQLTVNIQDSAKPFEASISLKDILSLKKFEKIRFEALQALAQLSPFMPGLDPHINAGGREAILMDTGGLTPFLMQAIPAIRLLGISVLLPKSLQQILKPRASIRIKQKSTGIGGLRLDKLLDFDWQVAIGDTLLDEEAFRKLVKTADGLVKYKTGYIYVSSADLEKLHKHFTQSGTLSSIEMLRAALSNDYFGEKVTLTDEVRQLIQELTSPENVPLPLGIRAQLRPYQQRGYSWMIRNTQIGFGSVIADDMGLGKTLQVIATLLKYKEDRLLEDAKVLVIVPTGLLTNWQAELERFAPSLRYKIYHGTSRSHSKKDQYDVLLTSYGVVRADVDKLKKLKWHAVVIDEAQNIKNHGTAQSKAVKSIGANTFIAMSGTPVENRLSELWSIMDFSNRGFLGTLTEFQDTFAAPIENQNDLKVACKLKAVTAPFLLRRLKSDKTIINDLPDKIEMDSFSHLVEEQASLYEKTLQKALEAIEGVESSDRKALFTRQGMVLQMILTLKQICNHPTQFLKNKILDPSLSGKMELLFNKLESIQENNEKVLIFTQFTEMGTLLQHFISKHFGETPLFYHGRCTLQQRKEMVRAFQEDPAEKIFILSLKAAGTGLNLTAANHVIHYDLWWNPAVETQATDRAYRIGQKNNVMVHRFITKGTFEERINEMIQQKKHLANLTVATGENWIGNLSNKELKEIFELTA